MESTNKTQLLNHTLEQFMLSIRNVYADAKTDIRKQVVENENLGTLLPEVGPE